MLRAFLSPTPLIIISALRRKTAYKLMLSLSGNLGEKRLYLIPEYLPVFFFWIRPLELLPRLFQYKTSLPGSTAVLKISYRSVSLQICVLHSNICTNGTFLRLESQTGTKNSKPVSLLNTRTTKITIKEKQAYYKKKVIQRSSNIKTIKISITN